MRGVKKEKIIKKRCSICNVLIKNGRKFCRPCASDRMDKRHRINQSKAQFNKINSSRQK